mgnify:CR=1 FL=1|tara:strand:+ start:272 stop:754 length:483 start_codon:yes stop_codon:yes gene_type:complete
MKKNIILPIFGLIILVVCILFYFNQSTQQKQSNLKVPQIIFEINDFYNDSLIDKDELGEFYVVNFFASWCKPCLIEHPLLIEMQNKGIKIIGVNFRDNLDNFKNWIDINGNPFEYVIIDNGDIAFQMGLIGVPETYFIKNHTIQKKIQGPLFYEDIKEYL